MTKRITIIALLVAFLASEASAQYHQNRRRGAILGGLAGAAIGVAIGDKGNNETAGALIGGAVGAIAGGTIGNQRDQQIEHNMRYHSNYGSPYSSGRYYGNGGYNNAGSMPHYYQPYVYEQTPVRHDPGPVVISPAPASTAVSRAAVVATTPTTVSKQDVLTMIGSGMSDAIIIRQLEIHGMDRALSVSEVIDLHRAGVSEPVITAMQLAGPDAASKITVSNPTDADKPRSRSDELYGPSVLPPPPPRPQAP